ncbi:MAG: ATP-binding protein [Sphingobacteriales bacterium]|nr:MAG: ATP-binding protein [Sphingobacteriales bacterium]
MITRALLSNLVQHIHLQKVTVLLGARRVGKTALLKALAEAVDAQILWLNGEDADAAALLADRSISNYKRLLAPYNLLIIDEAQYLPDIGRKVKLMIDEVQPLHIILTGSSAFSLSQEAGEPLVGRSITHHLYPIAQSELAQTESLLQTRQQLPDRLIYGGYPELFALPEHSQKEAYLRELVQSYLLRDILSFEAIRNPQKIQDLLKLIAHQVGAEVSLEELGRKLQISKNTVERYLDLLTKVFVLYKRTGYSNNLRKEITKSSRWYFYDNGIRNAVLQNFSPLVLRQDVGMLWENYVLAERLKFQNYSGTAVNRFFWRTYDQQEIDLVEEREGRLTGYELKFKPRGARVPAAFSKAYPEAVFEEISTENYLPFIGV